MTRILATAADAGRACPYCHFSIKQGAAAERCDACNSLHHEDCWRDGGGCAVFGCAMAATTAQQVGSPVTSDSPGVTPGPPPVTPDSATVRPAGPAVPPGAPVASSGTPFSSPGAPAVSPGAPAVPPGASSGGHAGYGPLAFPSTAAPSYPRRSVSPAILAVAALIALLGVGTGVVVATGVFSGGAHASTHGQTTVTTTASTPTQTVAAGPTAAEQRVARAAIMSLLASYQSSYSNHDIAGLSRIFSPEISRHGLAAGGCTVSHGRTAVLADYQSQFEEGSGSYRLIGLSEEAIHLDSKSRARMNLHYQISPGGTGYVNFKFADLGDGWKISEVYATCE